LALAAKCLVIGDTGRYSGKMLKWFEKRNLASYNPQLSREELIKRCRVLVIDDERPALIDDLVAAGFAVEHDAKGDDTAKIERNLYDLILLDFGGVGLRFGKDHGLSLLKHIKRVNPAPFVLAYTSKSLSPEQSEFYRLTDGTLFKDAGIQDSFSRLEQGLHQALNIERIWGAAVTLALRNSDDRRELEQVLMKCLKKRRFEPLYERLAHFAGTSVKDKLIGALIKKLIDLAFLGLLAA
jgi:DNA-binding NarL/FixJ family response regulator